MADHKYLAERAMHRWDVATQTWVPFEGSGAVVNEVVGVKNATDVRINPATEEKQDTLIAKDFATETTLEAVRVNTADIEAINEAIRLLLVDIDAVLNAIEAKDFATQATLAAFNTTFTDRFPKNAKQYADGLYRVVSTSQPVTASGSRMLRLTNPVGSGVTVTVVGFSLTADQDATVEIYLDRNLTAPTVVASWMPNRAYEGVAVTKGVVDTATAATGGTQVGEIRLGENLNVADDFVVTLMPGQSISLEASSGILSSFNLFASTTWIEDAL